MLQRSHELDKDHCEILTPVADALAGKLFHTGRTAQGRTLPLDLGTADGRFRRISPIAARSGKGLLTLMSEVKGRGSDLAFRLTAGRFLVIVIGCTGSEMER